MFSVLVNQQIPLNNQMVLPHLSNYTLTLINNSDRRCCATLKIDGVEFQGGFLILPKDNIEIHQPPELKKKFTFVQVDSLEAAKENVSPGNSENGIIRVTFTPEESKVYFEEKQRLEVAELRKARQAREAELEKRRVERRSKQQEEHEEQERLARARERDGEVFYEDSRARSGLEMFCVRLCRCFSRRPVATRNYSMATQGACSTLSGASGATAVAASVARRASYSRGGELSLQSTSFVQVIDQGLILERNADRIESASMRLTGASSSVRGNGSWFGSMGLSSASSPMTTTPLVQTMKKGATILTEDCDQFFYKVKAIDFYDYDLQEEIVIRLLVAE